MTSHSYKEFIIHETNVGYKNFQFQEKNNGSYRKAVSLIAITLFHMNLP